MNKHCCCLFYKIKGNLRRNELNRLIIFLSKNIVENKDERKENNGKINRSGKKLSGMFKRLKVLEKIMIGRSNTHVATVFLCC